MKKQYGKPEVSFENFSLTSNIALSCGSGLSYHAAGTCNYWATHSSGATSGCAFYDNGWSFFSNVGSCDVQPTPGNETWTEVCYHVIADEMTPFAS